MQTDQTLTGWPPFVVNAAIAAGAILVLLLFWIIRKGARLPGEQVFRASRLSRGNRLFPSQVAVTPDSLTLYTPQWIGKLEQSIHMAHVASVRIDTNLLFSDIYIESSGGENPVVCHGHTKGDAVRIKELIERYQTQYYRTKQ